MVRLRALRGLLADTVCEAQTNVATGDPVPRRVRGQARLTATIVTVDVLSGHVVFDYDTSRELRGPHTGYEDLADRDGVRKGSPMADDIRDRFTSAFQKYVANPLMRRNPFQTLLETTGASRASRGAHRWVAARWATSSGSSPSSATSRSTSRTSRPIPQVRVRLKGRWHKGIAHLVPDDDPHERLRSLPQFNSFGVRTFGTNLLTIRVDLERSTR